ncbi:DUF1564 family protein [Leptospira idonii]|uniref:DUF1564 family protein n=1 Tax=Leptospira idonii TaxID=1193500 RepID=A0A4R9M5B6_9LEPT|nr:DUF1564 family protein [Leptospira idonii]TGN20897.1 DUF1564 family protein [Leptospira idonii]
MEKNEILINGLDFKNWEFVRKRIFSELPEENHYDFQDDEDSSNTSFMVPQELCDRLKYIDGKPCTFSVKIRNLLEDSASLIYQGMITGRRRKITRTYQSQGLNLKKVSCRVVSQSLMEMDIISHALGISRSALLSLMLEWEVTGWLDIVRGAGLARDTTSLKILESNQRFDRTTYTKIAEYRVKITHLVDS